MSHRSAVSRPALGYKISCLYCINMKGIYIQVLAHYGTKACPLLYQILKEMYKLLVCCNTHVEILLIIKLVGGDVEDWFMHVPKHQVERE